MSMGMLCRDCDQDHENGYEAALCQRRIHDRSHRGSFESCAWAMCRIAAPALTDKQDQTP